MKRLTCMLLVLVMMMGAMALAESDAPIEIATAEQLAAINDNLSGHYVLTADIDLSEYENWQPIGAFQPLSDAPEDAEIPHPDYAFTGRFDGNGHTISNLTITSAPMMGAGLFGCASGTEQGEGYIGNFTLENVNVTGVYLVGGAVGLQFMNCKVSDIALVGENKLTGMQGIGGIVGTGFDLISNCSATADITALGDDGACAGLIAGGTTMSSIENCQAIGGSITAEGNATWAFGAICGAPWGAPEIRDCTASDTVIRVTGSGNRLVGGLLGFAGSYDPEHPAQIVGCKVENVTLEVSESTDSVGGLVGAGKEMMEGSDVMSSFEIGSCSVSGTITGGGEHVDAVVGDPACAVTISCEGGMSMESEADDAAAAAQLLEDVKGTYVALFPVITAPEYDQLWLDPCAAVVGEEAAPEVAEMLKAACNGTIYGQEAVDAFGDGSNGAQFDCLFINGVDQITFDGTTISGSLEGEEVFKHEYAYVGPLSLAGMMEGTLYETADADAGEFRYFYMMPDTPATTYHLEFRYGSDVDALTQYNEGPYAYWLAAGFPVDADEAMIENVVTLFCEENLAEMQADDAA